MHRHPSQSSGLRLPGREAVDVDRERGRPALANELEIEPELAHRPTADRALTRPEAPPHAFGAPLGNPAASDRLAGLQAQRLVAHRVVSMDVTHPTLGERQMADPGFPTGREGADRGSSGALAAPRLS